MNEKKNILRNPFLLVAIGSFGASICLPGKAKAASFDQIFIFGDSVSDTGNVFSLTGNTFPPPPLYSDGRFTSGEIWIDSLTRELDLEVTNFYGNDPVSSQSNLNFAIGGATTGASSLSGFPGVSIQVDNFLDFLGTETISEDALVILWAGGNDYVENLQNQGTLLDPRIPVNNLTNSLIRLSDAGAQNILVPNLFNLNDVPLAQSIFPPQLNEPLRQTTEIHNSVLEVSISNLTANSPETNISIFDVNTLIAGLIDDPTAFGFIDTPLESCLVPNNFPDISPTAVPCDNPDEYIFFDNQHFTPRVHTLIADAALETINQEFAQATPEPAGIIALLGFSLGLIQARKRN